MELLKTIVALFVVLCTVTADVGMSTKQAHTCASQCIDNHPSSENYIYFVERSLCVCKNDIGYRVSEKNIELDGQSNFREHDCNSMCFSLDNPSPVQYIAYQKTQNLCLCFHRSAEMFMVKGDQWAQSRKCWRRCLEATPVSAAFSYDVTADSCRCSNGEMQILD